jgi:glycosyltransferase EpsE
MTNPTQLVSILMSVHNSQETLDKALKSILNQTYTNTEILIMDDASTDASSEILDRYSKDYGNIKIYKNKINIGLTKSLNLLIKYANGIYIARQDADDFSNILRLEKQINFLNYHNLDACSTWAKNIDTDEKIHAFSNLFSPKLIIKYKNPFIHGSLLIKKDTLNKLNNYNEKFYYAQDYKLMTDLIKKNFRIKILPEILYELNMQNNISSNFSEEQKYFANCVRKDLIP